MNLPLHTHNDDQFYNPKSLRLASRTYTEWIQHK